MREALQESDSSQALLLFRRLLFSSSFSCRLGHRLGRSLFRSCLGSRFLGRLLGTLGGGGLLRVAESGTPVVRILFRRTDTKDSHGVVSLRSNRIPREGPCVP